MAEDSKKSGDIVADVIALVCSIIISLMFTGLVLAIGRGIVLAVMKLFED